MTRTRELVERMIAEEASLTGAVFVAPSVPGAVLRVRVAGLIRSFLPEPVGHEGFGLFTPVDARRARLVEEPARAVVDRYLALFGAVRLLLVHKKRGRSWVAMAANADDLARRTGLHGPVVVHLTEEAGAFEPIVARFDGASFFHDRPDRRADPRHAERLRAALRAALAPDELRIPGLTPEMKAAYALLAEADRTMRVRIAERRVERSLDGALRKGGGRLDSFQDRDGYFAVQWIDRHGRRHASAIGKELAVQTAGVVCLQGRDRDFDLASLVGVMSDAPDYFFE
jgi:hypothetical protein